MIILLDIIAWKNHRYTYHGRSSLTDVLLDEGLLEARVRDLLERLLDGVTIVQQEETNACGEFVEGIREVCEFLALLLNEAVLHSLRYDQCSLIQLSSLQTNCKRRVILIILRLNVDILIKQVQYRKEMVLFACIMQQGPLEHID